MTQTIKKQMGITHAEFFRLLPRALETDAYTVSGNAITVAGDGRSVHIELGPEGERRIALMRISTTDVTLTFDGYDDAGREAFLRRFDQAYQRGGG